MTIPAAEFAGFGEDAIEFFEGPTADNSREYWRQHRGTYDDSIAGPMSALADSLTAEFGRRKIFRMHRDLRFSQDRRPSHEYARMGVRPGAAPTPGTAGSTVTSGRAGNPRPLVEGHEGS